MTRKILLPLILFVALAAIEAALARWLPAPFHIPLLLPTLVAFAIHVPLQRLLRLAVLGALAGELISGVPQGVMFAMLTSTALLARAIFRRPELPAAVHGLTGAGIALLSIIVLEGVRSGFSFPPAQLFPKFFTAIILVPVLASGVVVSVISSAIDALQRRGLRPLGFNPGIVVQRLPSA